ncbi:MAG: MATE family efflux transporter [Phycisphaerae bacterium]
MSTTLAPRLDEAARRREELRGVIAMSVPMVITTCTRMVMDVTDYLMISRLTEGAAHAALLPAQLLLWTFIVIGMGIASIVATFAAQCLGRQRYRDCSAYGWQTLYIAAVFGVLGYGYWLLLPGLVAWMGHDSAVQVAELDYCRVAIWSVGPTIAAAGLSAFFNGIHHPRITMWSAIEGIVVNMGVSYVLIFGKLGLPAMGIAGAAAGTVVATCYRTLRLTVTLCLPRFNEKFHGRETWRLDRKKLAAILRVGLPQGAQWFSDVVVWLIFTSVLIGRMFGTEHLIANNVAWQYLRISFMPTIGMGMALTSLVGKAIGQGDPQRAVRQTRIGLLLAEGYMVLLSVMFLIWRRELIEFFNTEPQIVTIGASIMICAAVFQVFDGMGIVYTCALRGAGDTTWPSVVFVISHWTILVGGGYVMAVMFPSWGSMGPWVAGTTLLVLLGFVLWYRWHSRAWMKIDIFRHENKADAQPLPSAGGVEPALESSVG